LLDTVVKTTSTSVDVCSTSITEYDVATVILGLGVIVTTDVFVSLGGSIVVVSRTCCVIAGKVTSLVVRIVFVDGGRVLMIV